MPERDFDVIVIGGGSAGSSAAREASLAGARTAMINDGELGGLCILRGCMPTKAMLASAHALHETRHLEPFGLRMNGHAEADFAAVESVEALEALLASFRDAPVAMFSVWEPPSSLRSFSHEPPSLPRRCRRLLPRVSSPGLRARRGLPCDALRR